jgi:RND family efflux transporter MFP subunit
MYTFEPLVKAFVRTAVTICFIGANAVAADTTPVAVSTVTQVQLDDPVVLVGSVVPQRTTSISVQVNGMISSMWVDEGQRVKAGARLFQLDDNLARIDVNRRMAQLQQTQAELSETQRQLAESDRLRKDGYIPVSVLETAQTRVAVAQAVVGQRQADLAEAKENLSRHVITAPFDGIVTRKQAEQGQWLNPGATALQFIDASMVRVEIEVPQRHIAGISVGTQATIEIDALPGQRLTSLVTAVIPRGDNNARTVPVWLSVDNSAQQLLPGMSATVRLGLQSQQSMALAVPNDAVIRRADGSIVVWLIRNGEPNMTVQPLNVTLGRRDAQFSEIVGKGIKVGDQVVVRGNESLRPEQAVHIVGAQTVGG